jgi:nitric-oxide synthase
MPRPVSHTHHYILLSNFQLGFTQMLEKRFGWRGPSDGVKGAHDYLPLVCQVNPHEPPEIFEVPLEVAPPIHITHHQYPGLSSLGMRWYPIPAVSALDMVIGGLTYSACPFNGWYANTEVVRDLTDESRYNLLVPIGKALGLNVNVSPGDAPLWIDQAMSILSLAVSYS